jgi:hypothetical protein
MTAIDRALSMKRNGAAPNKLLRVFNKIVLNDASDVDRTIARYVLAVLASQMNDGDLADKHLHFLGYCVKLNPLIFSFPSCIEQLKKERTIEKGILTIDSVLPTPVIDHLSTVFQEDSPFFKEHDYPTPTFFSYNSSIREDDNIIVQTAQYLLPVLQQAFPDRKLETCQSVEWWVHCRSIADAHQLHFDTDEKKLEKYNQRQKGKQKESMSRKKIDKLHPLVSCVLYLETDTFSAPTLVTTQTLHTTADDVHNVEGYLCEALRNRLLAFDGRLLHGVVPTLPSSPASSSSSPSDHKNRITLMLGFWGGRKTPPSPSPSPSLSPPCPATNVSTTATPVTTSAPSTRLKPLNLKTRVGGTLRAAPLAPYPAPSTISHPLPSPLLGPNMTIPPIAPPAASKKTGKRGGGGEGRGEGRGECRSEGRVVGSDLSNRAVQWPSLLRSVDWKCTSHTDDADPMCVVPHPCSYVPALLHRVSTVWVDVAPPASAANDGDADDNDGDDGSKLSSKSKRRRTGEKNQGPGHKNGKKKREGREIKEAVSAVEFMTMADLQRLRQTQAQGQGQGVEGDDDDDDDGEGEEEEEVTFIGRWFLHDRDDIRNEILK